MMLVMTTEAHKRFSINLSEEHAISQRNYARLLRLFPHWREQDTHCFNVREGCEVTLVVQKRDVYSTLFSVVENGETSLPMLESTCVIRAYHDAKMIDIIEWNGVRRFKPRYDYPNNGMLARDEKWQLSRFLGEWFDHCLNQGRVITRPAGQGEPTV